MSPIKPSDPGNTTARLDRRELLTRAAALGLSFGMSGVPSFAAEAPKKGGTLKLGMAGGSASDSLDPRTYAAEISISYGYQIFNGLVEIGQNGEATGELFESWETKPGATEWVFNVRKGVTFHSGKTLDADDIIYSLNLHRGETKSGAKDLLSSIADIKKVNASQIAVTLNSGNADLPYILADYHILVVPNGFSDWNKPDGTGAYKLESFEPGVRILTKNTGFYWKPGKGWFDGIELRYIGDDAARSQALVSGQVDAINRLDPKVAAFVAKSPKLNIVQTKGTGNRLAFAALCDTDPFKSNDARMALKLGIDRQKIVDNVYRGFASIGNDTTVAPSSPYFLDNTASHHYDPDQAAFYWKKAGSPAFELQVSETGFSGAVDSAVLYQEALKQAGIPLDVKRVSGDGYWENVWLKAPFCATNWGPRPSIDAQLSQTFMSNASWNDTHWHDPEFDKLILAARTELDEAKRKQLYTEAQSKIADTGGMVCFAVTDLLDGYSKKIMGVAPHPRYELCDERLAEKAWFA